MNLWEKAIRFHEVPLMYQGVSLSDQELFTEKMINFGKNWVSSYPRCSLFLIGNIGSGKTHFSYAIFRGLVELNEPWIIFIRSCDMDSELLRAVECGQEMDKIRKYKEVPILFIDDIGTERINERILKQYYEIIDARFSNLMVTVFTSNLDMNGIKNSLGDRIASRMELCKQIKFPNRDLRKDMGPITF